MSTIDRFAKALPDGALFQVVRKESGSLIVQKLTFGIAILLGEGPDTLKGDIKLLLNHFVLDDRYKLEEFFRSASIDEAPISQVFRLRRTDNEGKRALKMKAAVSAGKDGDTLIEGFFFDNPDLRIAEDREDTQSLYDDLTGVPNRRLFEERLTQAMTLAKRNKGNVAVMYLDLNDFEAVNKRFGRKAGNEVLCAVTRRLEECLRASDTLARLDGDIFGIILPEANKGEEIVIVAERITSSFQAPFDFGKEKHELAVSIGISMYPLHSDSIEELLYFARRAMLSVREQSGDGYGMYREP